MSSSLSRVLLLAAVLAVGAPALPAAVAAQEVVQALPEEATADLNDALRRLSRNPSSLPALIDAGRASLQLDDIDAALGFFNRAQAIDPNNGRMLTGLALVAVRRGEAATAIQLFDNASAAGEPMASFAADRGLAYDLVGQNTRAQRLYRQALSREQSNEVLRRLALSYAIAGDAEASETTILPLLQRQDRAAYRTRAFVLAILGRDEEAVSIAETMLPAAVAGRLAPYLRYMPRLTAAQQAAAANLGRFPPAAQIGRDSPQIAALAREGEGGSAARPPSGGDRLTPTGPPLGRSEPVVQSLPEPSNVAAATAELPSIETTEVAAADPRPAQMPPSATIEPISEPVSPDSEQARPSFSISLPEVVEPQAEEEVELADAFADFVLPAGRSPVTVREGAVDITSIEPAREAPPPAPAPPPPPAHPSRHWVQVATGQDTSAFRFDWRRLVRTSQGALEGRRAFTARWGQTNRLVTGPFESARAANEFVARLGEAEIDSFRFTSAEGEEVSPLD